MLNFLFWNILIQFLKICTFICPVICHIYPPFPPYNSFESLPCRLSVQTLCTSRFNVYCPMSTAQDHRWRILCINALRIKGSRTSQETGLNKCKTRNKGEVWNATAHFISEHTMVICRTSRGPDSLTNAIKTWKNKTMEELRKRTTQAFPRGYGSLWKASKIIEIS